MVISTNGVITNKFPQLVNISDEKTGKKKKKKVQMDPNKHYKKRKEVFFRAMLLAATYIKY